MPSSKSKRRRSRSRSRSRVKGEGTEEYTLRGRRRRRPRYWDMTPEEAHKLGLPMTRQAEMLQLKTIEQSQAKIYCGFKFLAFTPSEEDMRQFFNATMVAAQGPDRKPGDSVTRVFIDPVKRYAFINFRSQEEAEQALELDGIMFRGARLKLARPTANASHPNTAPASITRPIKPLNLTNLNIIKSQVPDGPHKIYIGGLPQTLQDEQVKELLQTYGPLRAFFLFKDASTGLGRGFAFAEYRDHSVTQPAIRGLNGIKIGDRRLQVALHDPSLSGQQREPPNLTDLGLKAMPTSQPTTCLCLLQMVVEEDLVDEAEYKDICDDIKQECDSYGKTLDFKIPRANDNKGKGVGKVFVLYETIEQCQKAKKALEGRQFMNRTVLATFYDPQKFKSGDW